MYWQYTKNPSYYFHRLPTRLPDRSFSQARATVTPFANAAAHAHRRHAPSRRNLAPPTLDATRATLQLPPTSHADPLPVRESPSTELFAPHVGLRSSSSCNTPTVGTVPRYACQPVDQKRCFLPPLIKIPRRHGSKNARKEPATDASTRRSWNET